ncbi:hypothetical protein FD733_05670 [Pantoea sp. Eser]|nr:hypothetical protein [Pantoea sp. Eser]
MNISIIGAGNIGATLARKLAAAGHTLRLANSRGPNSIQTLAEKGQPAGQPDRLAIPVAGDDPQAKAVAMTLVDATGFDAVDAGSLSDSWRQQPGTPAYCTELSCPALVTALQAADRDRTPHNRDALINEFMSAGELTHAAIVARNRAITA